jgi:uracil-DNA glycosylase
METWKNAIPNFSALLEPIKKKLKEEREKHTIYPDPFDILKALALTPLPEVRVVILGQDPYHNGAADGLAFSSKNPSSCPASLNNIFKQIADDFGVPQCGYSWNEYFPTTSLETWAKKGILLLNTCLSVREGNAGSHDNIGWQDFTKTIISAVNCVNQPIVFMLWGNHAKSFKSLLNNPKHLILESAHPSPLTQGFIGNQHFIKAVSFLATHGRINSISLRKHFNFKTAHEEIKTLGQEKKWTPEFTQGLIDELDKSNFFMQLNESIHLFSTSKTPL